MMFIHYDGKVVNADEIRLINTDELVTKGWIRIYFKPNDRVEIVEGVEAFNIVMTLCPAALEGKRAKYARHAWAIHNLIGHPLMQIFSWLRLPALGIKVHDATVPEPDLDRNP